MTRGGQVTDAIALLAATREILGADGEAVAAQRLALLVEEGALHVAVDDGAAAVERFTEALAVAENGPGLPTSGVAQIRMELGEVEFRRGRLRASLKHFTQAAEEFDLDARAAVQSFKCRRGIAGSAEQLGYIAHAEKLLRELNGIPAPPESTLERLRAESLIDLGTVLFRQNRLDEAAAAYRQAEAFFGSAKDQLIPRFDIAHNLGNTYTHAGKYEAAAIEFDRAEAIARDMFSTQHHLVGLLQRNRGALLLRMGREEEAAQAFERALEIFAVSPGAAPDVAHAHLSRGESFARQREWDEAEYHFRLALDKQTEAFGEDHPATARAMVSIGHVLRDSGALHQARPMLNNAIRILEDARYDPALLAEAYGSLHLVQAGLGQQRESHRSLEKANFYSQMARPAKGKPN